MVDEEIKAREASRGPSEVLLPACSAPAVGLRVQPGPMPAEQAAGLILHAQSTSAFQHR